MARVLHNTNKKLRVEEELEWWMTKENLKPLRLLMMMKKGAMMNDLWYTIPWLLLTQE